MDKKIKHLEIIQGVVNRLSTNSFLLKGWTVVLLSALFALVAKSNNVFFVYIAYLPVCAFWVLDGYFLSIERMYRDKYNEVRLVKDDDEIDFSMALDNLGFKKWATSVFSRTLSVFYGVLLFLVFVVSIVMCTQK